MTTARIAATLIALPLLFAAYIVIGTAFAVNGLAQWRAAGAPAAVAEQRTEQTRIEWAGRVEVAKVEADADKKTSWAYVGFWLLRATTWLTTIAAVIVAGLVAYIKLIKRH